MTPPAASQLDTRGQPTSELPEHHVEVTEGGEYPGETYIYCRDCPDGGTGQSGGNGLVRTDDNVFWSGGQDSGLVALLDWMERHGALG